MEEKNIEERKAAAVEIKHAGHNCAQAVAMALAEEFSLDKEAVKDITAAFGSGFGNTHGTCGAIVGAGVIAGMCIKDKTKARTVLGEITDEFYKRNGSIVCRDLKGIDTGRVLRSCDGCVADAVELGIVKLGIGKSGV